MKKLTYVSYCFYISMYWLLLILFVAACGENPSEKKMIPYFWKAQKDGKTSYFLGTMHRGVVLEELQCSKVIKSHLKGSDYLFVEGNEFEIRKRSQILLQKIKSKTYTEFYTLSTHSQNFFKNRELPNYNSYNYAGYSIMLEILCTIDFKNKHWLKAKDCPSLGFPLDMMCLKDSAPKMNIDAVDSQIESLARKQGLAIGSLDHGIDSIDTDATMSALLQNNLKSKDIDLQVLNFDESCMSRTQLINEYKTNQLELENETLGSHEQDIVLLKNRNEKWIDKFKRMHQVHQQIFIAAGLAHFTMKFNMLDMLKVEGFSIQRIQSSCQF